VRFLLAVIGAMLLKVSGQPGDLAQAQLQSTREIPEGKLGETIRVQIPLTALAPKTIQGRFSTKNDAGVRKKTQVIYASALSVFFAVEPSREGSSVKPPPQTMHQLPPSTPSLVLPKK